MEELVDEEGRPREENLNEISHIQAWTRGIQGRAAAARKKEAPKTLIIGANLHGEIILDEDNTPVTEPLEIGTLIHINVTEAAVCSVSNTRTHQRISEEVYKYVNYQTEGAARGWDKKIHTLDKIAENILEITDEHTDRNLRKARREFMKEYPEKSRHAFDRKHISEDRELQKYIDSLWISKENYGITKFRRGDKVPEKTFSGLTEDELEGGNHTNDEYVNTIFVYNHAKAMFQDLFDQLWTMNKEVAEQALETGIKLSQLIKFFKDIHGEDIDIILVDLSCESVDPDNQMISREEMIEKIKTDMIKKGYRNNVSRRRKRWRPSRAKKPFVRGGRAGKTRRRPRKKANKYKSKRRRKPSKI